MLLKLMLFLSVIICNNDTKEETSCKSEEGYNPTYFS